MSFSIEATDYFPKRKKRCDRPATLCHNLNGYFIIATKVCSLGMFKLNQMIGRTYRLEHTPPHLYTEAINNNNDEDNLEESTEAYECTYVSGWLSRMPCRCLSSFVV